MKILILANNDIGLYKFRKELLERFIEDNHEVYISLPDGKYVKKMINMGCVFIQTKIMRHGKNPFYDLKLLKTYISILKHVKPDIVFSYTIKPNIYGGIACSLTNVPYVVNITGLGTAVENKSLLQLITINLYRISLKKVHTVFFQNQENKNFFVQKKIIRENYGLLPGSGVNLKNFLPLEYPNDDIIQFVFISRIMKEKGIDYFLEAAKYIKSKYPNTVFHICGFCEKEYQNKLSELENSNIIHYHGLIDDITDILRVTHCTIHPTYYPEGMSNVLLESCACARPIITTNRSGCKEIVDNGINGFIVKQRDTKDLINKIEDFINLSSEEKKIMGVNGRKKVEKYFDRNIVIEKYLNVLKECK